MIFIDSDYIIDLLRGRPNSLELVDEYKEEIATTEINVFEVMFGIYFKKSISEKEIKIAKEFFGCIKVYNFSNGCGEIASKLMSKLLKKGQGIDQNDCLIASIILKNGFNQILTNNKKHFSRIKELKIVE